MTEALAAPPAPTAAAPATAAGTAPTAPPGTPADAFLAVLMAMPTAAPPGTAVASARTAIAEGATPGDDTSGPGTETPATGDLGGTLQASSQGLMALFAMGTLPVQVATQTASAPAKGGPQAPPVQVSSARSLPAPVAVPSPAEATAPVADQTPIAVTSPVAATAPIAVTAPTAVTTPAVADPATRNMQQAPDPAREASSQPIVKTGPVPSVHAALPSSPATPAAAVPTTTPVATPASPEAAAPAPEKVPDATSTVTAGRSHEAAQPAATPQARPQHEAPTTTTVNQHGQQAPQDGQTPNQRQSDHHAAVQDKLETAPIAGAVKTDQTVVLAEASPPAQIRQADAVEAAARPVHLRELPEAFRTAVRVAVREGHTSAQLELHPAELGRVEIALRYDSNGGVTASVTAESRAAATALLAQAPELRRALEAQGLTVHGLDVHQAGVGAETSPDRDRLGSFERQPDNDRSSEIETDETTTIDVSKLPLAAGQLDVLA